MTVDTDTDVPSLDDAPPTPAIKDVTRIGGENAPDDNTAQIGAASDQQLLDKLAEYETAGEILVKHHEYMKDRFDELFTVYCEFFVQLDVLGEVATSIKAVLPSFRLQESFSFIELPDELQSKVDEFSDVILYGTIGTTVVSVGGGVINSYLAWKNAKLTYADKAGSMVRQFRFQSFPDAEVKALKAAGNARVWRALGVVGAVMGVVGAGASIYANYKTEEKKREFLEDSVFSFQSWFEKTQDSYAGLKGGVDTMSEALKEMMVIFGIVAADDENPITEANVTALKNNLRAISTSMGRTSAMVELAARMFCLDATISTNTVVSLTGLSVQKVNDIADQTTGTNRDAICAIVNPPEPAPEET